MILTYEISDVEPYINWAYFYFAWQLKQKEEQLRMRKEAETFLSSLEGRYRAHAVFRLFTAHSDGDDIVIEKGQNVEKEMEQDERLVLLRQQ
jgi:cobalamin-dependent methionine synthase I